MKIKMLENALGSQTGTFVEQFLKGEIYEVSEELGLCFFDMAVAELAEEKAAEEEVKEEKAKNAAPKNKAK